MKRLLVIICIFSPSILPAEYIYKTRVGNRDYYNGSEGYNAVGYKVGNREYINDNSGNQITIDRYGKQEFISIQNNSIKQHENSIYNDENKYQFDSSKHNLNQYNQDR